MSTEKKKRKPSSSYFKPGQSGNPGGFTKFMRKERKRARDMLNDALTREDGTDLLVDAIVEGVKAREGKCIQLACEYRWGKPQQHVTVEDSASEASDETLELTVAAIIARRRAERQQQDALQLGVN